jgi:hypothetical protein
MTRSVVKNHTIFKEGKRKERNRDTPPLSVTSFQKEPDRVLPKGLVAGDGAID